MNSFAVQFRLECVSCINATILDALGRIICFSETLSDNSQDMAMKRRQGMKKLKHEDAYAILWRQCQGKINESSQRNMVSHVEWCG